MREDEDTTAAEGSGHSRRTFLAAGAASSAALYLAACGGGSSSTDSTPSTSTAAAGSTTAPAEKVTLNNLFMQQAGYSPEDLAGMTKQFEAANPNIKINNTLVSYDALHDKIVAAAPAGTYDIVLGDVIWPAEFSSKKIVSDISDKVNSLPVDQIFQGAIQTAEYQNKFYGMPWLLDTKYLFTNGAMLKKAGLTVKDLTTWSDVTNALQTLKSKNIVKYPWIGSWAQAEAVVCDYAQFLGAFGGKFLDAAGKPAFNTGGGVVALQFMVMLLDKKLANPSSTSALEADVLKSFQQGQNALNLNWTFQYLGATDPKQSKVAKDDVGIMRTPQGQPGVDAPGCNGSQPLMVASGSKHPNEAWEYMKFITSQDIQNQFVKSSLPIWISSYDDPQVIKDGGPAVVAAAKEQLPKLINRPQVVNYNAASHELQVEIQNALLGRKTPQEALNDAAKAFTSGAPS